MLEIEMKFPVADFTAVETNLGRLGFQPGDTVIEADHYFNAPDRDFGQTDEALRLRRVDDKNRVTYKGPKRAGPAKTRTEIEVPLAAGAGPAEDFQRLLVSLGYRPTAVVRKRRRSFHLDRDGFALEATLDDVDQVGQFAEVEILAPEENVSAAERTLQQIAAELGLQNPERRSYLEMLLIRLAATR